jgi:hypothetical protein
MEYFQYSGNFSGMRISRQAVVNAIIKVQAMTRAQKEQLVDELFRVQPHMFGSFLVQKQLGVSYEKMEFLLEMLFTCFQAMKESGLNWPLISEDEQERQMARYTATVKFSEDLSTDLQERAMQQYVESHPEKELLAYVFTESVNWLKRVTPEESDKYVMLAAANFVNCIAFVPLPRTK